MITEQEILQKYSSTISEEVNVKKVSLLPDDIKVTKIYVPLGQKLSSKFGKDTGKIIQAAKQGSVEELENGQLKVIQGNDSWTLKMGDYEIRYSGLDEKRQTVEDGVIVDLDLELTDKLIVEGTAREISRFLNQMRKDADYDVSDRVECFWSTDSDYLENIVEQFSNFLSAEALLKEIKTGNGKGDIEAVFEVEEGKIIFVLKNPSE